MKKINFIPSVSIVIASYNSDRTIERTLKSIRMQKYPQEKLEIILADGGSKDNTREIAAKYNVKFISIDPKKQNAEYNKSVGLHKAKNELVAFIDHDNVLPHSLWMKKMVLPLSIDPDIVGVETLRYHYDPTTSLLDRYFALFGAGDPLVWYLGRADRLSYVYDTYRLSGKAVDAGDYYKAQFTIENMPTIGANGFMVRREVLIRNAQTSPGKYFDMDVNIDLILKGFNTYAFTKDSILHLTGYGNVWAFLKRRMLFIGQYNRGKDSKGKRVRRYGILSKKGVLRLGLSILICATFVIPTIDAIRGYRKIPDVAWFLHPFLCFAIVSIYSWVIVKSTFKRYAKKFLAS